MKKITLFVTLLLLAALVCSPAAFARNVPTVQWNSASGHVHDFSACVAEADYLYSAATYESPALYYKSCSCGLSSVGTLYEAFFEDGRPGDGYYSVVSRKDWDIAPGIKESEIVLNEASGTRRQVMRVMEVDTSDPYVSVLPSYMGMNPTPGNYRTAPMTEQAVWVRDNMGLNVVGGMNTCLTWYDSDFYLENPHLIGEPLGILITMVIPGAGQNNNGQRRVCVPHLTEQAAVGGLQFFEIRSIVIVIQHEYTHVQLLEVIAHGDLPFCAARKAQIEVIAVQPAGKQTGITVARTGSARPLRDG